MAYTVAEAAESLGVSRSSMYRMVTSGEVKSITYGRSRRIPRSALGRVAGVDPAALAAGVPTSPRKPVKRTVVLVEIDTLTAVEPEVRVFFNGKQVLG